MPAENGEAVILTPDQRLRVFVSSTLVELAEERIAVQRAIERVRLSPVLFELGARPHPPRDLYRAYLRQSHIFLGIYYQRYGWVAPGEQISGLEDEFQLSAGMPRLLYIKRSTVAIEPRLEALLDQIRDEGSASYRSFTDAEELHRLVREDLATLLSERFLLAERPGPEAVATTYPDAVPPVPLTATIGREHDLEELSRLLEQGRLLTIVGPGGIGKSRLALELARRVAPRYDGGAVLVPPENLSRSDQVMRAIAMRLGAPDTGTRPLVDVLADELAGRRLLLVVDNMEQVIDAGHELSELLGRCPDLSAVVTSRHVLRLRGEQEYHLRPLSDLGAIALFTQRAASVHPGFRLTPENRPAVTEIVRLLDGLPLAIELAAARTRLLSPAEIAERLSSGIDLLGGGAGDLPSRQRTLRDTLLWSSRLLAATERTLFLRISTFVGGATLEAIAAVCGDGIPDVLATVSSLVEKSLLVASDGHLDGEARISMLRTVRLWAYQVLLEEGGAQEVGARHAHWYADFAEPADVLRHTRAPSYWPRLEGELDNLRAAAEHAMAAPDGALMVDLGRRLWPWLWSGDRVGTLKDAVSHSLRALPEDAPPAQRGYLCYVGSYTAGLTGDFPAALRLVEQALDLLAGDTVDGTLLIAAARLVRGTVRMALGQDEGVEADMDHAVHVGRRLGCAWLLGYATSHRGLQRAMRSELDAARADHETSLSQAEAMGHEVLIAQALGQLAIVDVLDGQLAEARARLRRQLGHLVGNRHLEGLANALDISAGLAVAENRWTAALRCTTAAEVVRGRIGLAPWPLLDRYHLQAAEAAKLHMGDQSPAVTTGARTADPWSVLAEELPG